VVGGVAGAAEEAVNWIYPALSNVGVYIVAFADSGALTCTCPKWARKRRGRPFECQHVMHVIVSHGWTRDVRGDFVFVLDITFN
jgi:hypothetical protein